MTQPPLHSQRCAFPAELLLHPDTFLFCSATSAPYRYPLHIRGNRYGKNASWQMDPLHIEREQARAGWLAPRVPLLAA